MQKEELMNKLAPKTLTKERLRIIMALARYLRTELSHAEPLNALEGSDQPVRDDDDRVAH